MHAGWCALSRNRLLLASIAAICVLSASSASAAPSCTISTTSVNFGNYNVFGGAPTDSTGTITFNCKGNANNIVITLSKGGSATYNPRTMLKSGEALNYNLFQDAARTSIWGDGSGGTSTYTNANPANNTDINVTVYGRVPIGQDVSAGAYSDTVSAVINF